MKATLPPDEYLTKIAKGFDLVKLLKLPDEFFAKTVHPLMYNYISEKKYFRRNAAIAMGNSGDSSFVPVLAESMEEADGMVRSHVAWALGKIGGSQARRILETSLARETGRIGEEGDRSGLGRRLTNPEMTGPTARKALERRP